MANIIFLNGISSSGKTSIAKAIQYISPIPFLHFGIDNIIDMMPSNWLSFNENGKDGCYFEKYENQYGKAVSCNVGPYGKSIFEMGIKLIKTILDCNLDIIIDEVIWNQDQMDSYRELFKGHKVVFVKIYCEREVAQEREILRGNREIGLANDQFDKVESIKWNYDLVIDSNASRSFEIGKKILKLII
jgi:chloramphenicol 3-O phosphotransferase